MWTALDRNSSYPHVGTPGYSRTLRFIYKRGSPMLFDTTVQSSTHYRSCQCFTHGLPQIWVSIQAMISGVLGIGRNGLIRPTFALSSSLYRPIVPQSHTRLGKARREIMTSNSMPP